MGETRNSNTILVCELYGKRKLWRPRYRWETNIKTSLRET
jgi:hypothetical protein